MPATKAAARRFVFCDDIETDFDIVTAGSEDDDFMLHVDFGGSP